jgi:DNA gyrase/topoisomerase IV subunit A
VRDDDEIMLLTAKGQSVRCPVKDIRETNRGAKGVKLLTLAEGDKLLSIAGLAFIPVHAFWIPATLPYFLILAGLKRRYQ